MELTLRLYSSCVISRLQVERRRISGYPYSIECTSAKDAESHERMVTKNVTVQEVSTFFVTAQCVVKSLQLTCKSVTGVTEHGLDGLKVQA